MSCFFTLLVIYHQPVRVPDNATVAVLQHHVNAHAQREKQRRGSRRGKERRRGDERRRGEGD